MSTKAADLTGQAFGRLTVIARAAPARGGAVRWHCVCECGRETTPKGANLRCGITTSCGCGRKTHGLYGSPSYWTWTSMLARCHRPGSKSYPNYGAVGISVCADWRESFETFIADMGERPAGKTLDRINNHLGYSRANCRWATPEEQAANRRGARKRIDSGVPYKGVERRGNVWRARIRSAGKYRSIGHFHTAEAAALAYDAEARRHYGDAAAVNFPATGERGAISQTRRLANRQD